MKRSKSTSKPAKLAASQPLANRLAQTGTGFRAGGGTLGQRVERANRWREGYNPLRGLTFPRVIAMIEDYSRGIFADLMWTLGAPFMGIEVADPTYVALIERRVGAIGELDWDIRTVDEDRPDFNATLAAEQAAALRQAYDKIGNLQEAIEHLSMATFRAFAHLEKIASFDGTLTELRPVNQWNVARDGMYGGWKYNPDALNTGFTSLPEDNLMAPEWFIVREVRRPIGRFALTKFLRSNLCEKDWDAFIEIFGIPGGVVIGPPNVPQEKESEYQSAAEAIAKGGTGYLPNGSQYNANDSARGIQPFQPRLTYLDSMLVLAGTCGMLTMLAQSGTGTLAGSAHMEAFKTLARAEAKQISERFQRQIDHEVLNRQFPGRPQLAYFQLDANEEQDTTEIFEHAVRAKQAGFLMEANELSEKTGYQLTPAPAAPAVTGAEFSPLQNRRLLNARQPLTPEFIKSMREMLVSATARDLRPLRDRLRKIAALPTQEEMETALAALRDDLPALLKKINAKPAAAQALEKILGTALVAGFTAPPNQPV